MAPDATEDYQKLRQVKKEADSSAAPAAKDKPSRERAPSKDEREEKPAKAEPEAQGSAMGFLILVAVGGFLAAIVGAAGGAWFGAKSVAPPSPVAEAEELEEVKEPAPKVDLSQGLDLALGKPLTAAAQAGVSDLVPAGLRMTPMPDATAADRESPLPPEEQREIARPYRPRAVPTHQLGYATDSDVPEANAGGLDRSEPLELRAVEPRPEPFPLGEVPGFTLPEPRVGVDTALEDQTSPVLSRPLEPGLMESTAD